MPPAPTIPALTEPEQPTPDKVLCYTTDTPTHHEGGAPDGSPHQPRNAGGYGGGRAPPIGAPGVARAGGHPPAPAAGAPAPPLPIVPNRLPLAQPGEPVVDTRGYRFIHSLLTPPGVNPTWPINSVQSLAVCLQLSAVVGDEPAAHQALSELGGICFRAGSVGTSSSTFVDDDVRQNNAKFAILGDLRNVSDTTSGAWPRPWVSPSAPGRSTTAPTSTSAPFVTCPVSVVPFTPPHLGACDRPTRRRHPVPQHRRSYGPVRLVYRCRHQPR